MRQRFGNGGGRAAVAAAGRPTASSGDPTIPITERNADKIDELYVPMPNEDHAGPVWTWDEANKELKSTASRSA